MIDESNNDNGSGVGDDEVYRDKGKKPVLASLLDLYFELEVILVSATRSSFCPTSHFLLTT